jgi:hypothetical protein
VTARRLLAAVVFGCLALAACGGVAGMNDSAAADLSARVASVRAAVSNGDHDAAEEALSDLHLAVVNLTTRGEITEGKASDILQAAERVSAALSLLSPEPTTTLPLGDEEEDEDDEDDDEGEVEGDDEVFVPGNGKGKGKSGKD